MMSISLKFPAIALAFAAFAMSQPASAVQEQGDAAAVKHPASVIVFDQKIDGSAVKLSYIFAPDKSHAVVYGSDQNGRHTGKALGSVAVEPGDHRDIKIPLKTEAKSGDKLWISIYRAQDGGTAFDAEKDVSYWAQDEHLPSTNGFVVR
ncbi:hypothetical protein [Hyphomicrobium sp.]|uniref:DUF7282 domain-containing protein n=1 Tax=Hyphomicrobium sp. TaxID=82 RepID=UPI000FBC77CD|nr:hypothetical protein [Hyphomicrobium sp.]RUP09580.1 MAG: hypothetical protein EKK38_09545 [Hyphomicrobium sp.]